MKGVAGATALLTPPEILPCGSGTPQLHSSEFLQHLPLLPSALSWQVSELQPLKPEAYSSSKITLFSHLTVHTKKCRPTEGKDSFWALDHVSGFELPSLQSQMIPLAHHYLQSGRTGPAPRMYCTLGGSLHNYRAAPTVSHGSWAILPVAVYHPKPVGFQRI